MSNSVRPHRRQPTRLPRPWDSPGKNTGVGCHFLLHCMKVKSESEVAQLCPTLPDPMDCTPPGSSVHVIPGKSTGVGCHCLPCFFCGRHLILIVFNTRATLRVGLSPISQVRRLRLGGVEAPAQGATVLPKGGTQEPTIVGAVWGWVCDQKA